MPKGVSDVPVNHLSCGLHVDFSAPNVMTSCATSSFPTEDEIISNYILCGTLLILECITLWKYAGFNSDRDFLGFFFFCIVKCDIHTKSECIKYVQFKEWL